MRTTEEGINACQVQRNDEDAARFFDLLQFKQYAITEVKQDSIREYNLYSDCRTNNVTLLGSSSELLTLELTPNINTRTKFPYNIANGAVTQKHPLNKIMEPIRLQQIFSNCTPLESQELALEPVYIAACSQQPAVAKIIQTAWAPQTLPNNCQLMAELTSYGALQLHTKATTSTLWQQQKQLDLTSLIYKKIVPHAKLDAANITSLANLKQYFDRFWITAFVWLDCTAANELQLILGTAAGYVISLKLNAAADTLLDYKCTKTEMKRICTLVFKNDLLLIGNAVGVVALYKLNEKGTVEQVEYLWSRSDRMGIQHAEITRLDESDKYYIIFTKAAHVLAFLVDRFGKMCCNATLYLGGLKISGLVSLTPNTFLLTTINCLVHYLTLTTNAAATDLNINNSLVSTDLDAEINQLLGISVSKHRCLITLLVCRNCDYQLQQNNYTRYSVFVSVGQLNTLDPLKEIYATNINDMQAHLDLLTAIRLKLVNDINITDFLNNNEKIINDFMESSPLVNDALQQRLQINYLIMESTSQVLYDKQFKESIQDVCKQQLDFLLLALQIVHIMRRLQYLNEIDQKHTTFQQKVLMNMRLRFEQLTAELLAMSDRTELLTLPITNFIQLTECGFKTLTKVNKILNLQPYASEEIVQLPNTQICTLSYMPLEPDLEQRYCKLCGRLALLDIELLQQIFDIHVSGIRCTYCRSSFICSTE